MKALTPNEIQRYYDEVDRKKEILNFNRDKVIKIQSDSLFSKHRDEIENVINGIKTQARLDRNSAMFDSMSGYVIIWLEERDFAVEEKREGLNSYILVSW